MIENNRIEKSFGPVASFAGMVVFAGGLVMIVSSLYGIILILIGALFGFTYSSTVVDYDRKRMKFTQHIFGLFRTGKWIEINDRMKAGVIATNTTWRTNSRSNRSIDLDQSDILLVLYGDDDKIIIPIKKLKTLATAETEIEAICKRFGLQRE